MVADGWRYNTADVPSEYANQPEVIDYTPSTTYLPAVVQNITTLPSEMEHSVFFSPNRTTVYI